MNITEINKKEFLPFLKSISDSLDKSNIQHDIPFCHIDKMTFNHIYIIIPDVVTLEDIEKNITLIHLKEINNIIYTKIDDFSVNFVKTSQELWNYTFHYYCWNILPNLIDVLVSYFNMSYTKNGLKYIYKDKEIFLSKNLKDIFNFFNLNINFITLGFPTPYTIFEFIQSSIYFQSSLFIKDKFKENDKMYEYNKQYYKDFIKYKTDIDAEYKGEEDKLVLIDAYFKESHFIEKLYNFQLKEEFPTTHKDKIYDNVSNDDKLKKLSYVLEEKKKKKGLNFNKFFKKDGEPDFKFE